MRAKEIAALIERDRMREDAPYLLESDSGRSDEVVADTQVELGMNEELSRE
jgi:hypothetical protein